eukprot:TRINITY_DN28988_c0_g1_i1.p1 TRINITY_DN28988_c0_g1~~TRINITY_DN28988_c0_g1_i1.p1  ORF type:complete len:191 (+),score=50.69 TRINITY_DN28988_c0_g1_i1:90-662(+)
MELRSFALGVSIGLLACALMALSQMEETGLAAWLESRPLDASSDSFDSFEEAEDEDREEERDLLLVREEEPLAARLLKGSGGGGEDATSTNDSSIVVTTKAPYVYHNKDFGKNLLIASITFFIVFTFGSVMIGNLYLENLRPDSAGKPEPESERPEGRTIATDVPTTEVRELYESDFSPHKPTVQLVTAS